MVSFINAFIINAMVTYHPIQLGLDGATIRKNSTIDNTTCVFHEIKALYIAEFINQYALSINMNDRSRSGSCTPHDARLMKNVSSIMHIKYSGHNMITLYERFVLNRAKLIDSYVDTYGVFLDFIIYGTCWTIIGCVGACYLACRPVYA